MLQRIQSVWLLLAAVFCAITFRFPFYSGDWIKDNFLFVIDLNAKTTIWFTILTVLDAVLAFITIFSKREAAIEVKASTAMPIGLRRTIYEWRLSSKVWRRFTANLSHPPLYYGQI